MLDLARSKICFLCVCLMFAVFVPSSSFAQTSASTGGKGDASAQLARARQFFQEEKFADAAEAMMRAYAADEKPLYLFNAAQAYRKAQRYQESLDLYKRYIEVAPQGPLANEAQGHKQDMEALLKEQGNRQEVKMLLESEQAEKQKTQEELEGEKKKSLFMEQALKKERDKPFYKKTWFVATASIVGGGLVVVGLVFLSFAANGITNGGTQTVKF